MPKTTDTACRKILFTSGKGGVGKSTLASSFGKVLSSMGRSVLIIDFDVAFRTQDLMLGLGENALYDWADVLLDRCEPLEAVLTNKRGPELVPAPLEPPEASEDEIRKLVSRYEPYYDYILLDSPAGVGQGFHAAQAAADLALVISTPDKVCVSSAAVAAEQLMDHGIESRLIINRFKKRLVANGRALNIDDVIDSTGVQLIGVVPEDPYLAEAAQDGTALMEDRKSTRAILRILRRLDGESVPLKF